MKRFKELTSMVITRIRARDPETLAVKKLKESVVGPKRNPFKKARVIVPWYSIYRPRNIWIAGVITLWWMFSGGIHAVRVNVRDSFRLDNERKKFIKQLDEEDKQLGIK